MIVEGYNVEESMVYQHRMKAHSKRQNNPLMGSIVMIRTFRRGKTRCRMSRS